MAATPSSSARAPPAASPDFPGATREVLEKTIGGLALFLRGGGDIRPIGGMGYETDCRDAKNRVGTILGAEAVKVAAGLRTHARRGERTSLPSLLGAGMTLTPWVPVEGETCTYPGAISETVTLGLVPFPSLEAANEIRAERQHELAEVKASATERNVTVATRFAIWADTLVEAKEHIAGGVGHDVRHNPIAPIYVERAAGSREWDVDGNEYIHYGMGNGALLLSQDNCYQGHLKVSGGNGYDYVPTRFVPLLKEAGLSDEQVRALLVENPRRVLAGER